MLDGGAPGRKLHVRIGREGERGLDGHRHRRPEANPLRRRERRNGADGIGLGRAWQRRQRDRGADVRIAMRGERNAQLAAAAGDEQDVDAPGEDGADMRQRVLVFDGVIAGRQQQARGSIGDQERETVAGAEDRHLWRGPVLQPAGEGGDRSRGGDEEDEDGGRDDLLPRAGDRPCRIGHGWPTTANGDEPRLSETRTVSPGATRVPGGGSCATTALSGTLSE
jgi:hypothetical protein